MPRKVRTPRDELEHQIAEREKRGWLSATPERTLQSGDELVLDGDGRDGHSRRQVVSVSIIDRLKAHKKITPRLHEAGDKLRKDMRRAGLDGAFPSIQWDTRAIVDKNPAATLAGFATEETIEARHRFRDAMAAVGRHLWPILEMAVCVAPAGTTLGHVGSVLFGRSDNKATEAAATENLRIALRVLADHYFGPEKTAGEHIWLSADVSSRRAGRMVHKAGRVSSDAR